MESLNIKEIIDKFKIPIALSLIGIVLIVGGMISSGIFHDNSGQKNFPKESMVDTQKSISVDVSGAVAKPGVYQLKSGARVEEAISAAGGLTELANKDYISKYVNMAQKLSDGSKVYLPFIGEQAPAAGGLSGTSGVAGVSAQEKININSASSSQLESLSGIGVVTAAKIISGRPYQKIEDLLNLKIVSKSTFEKIKDALVIF